VSAALLLQNVEGTKNCNFSTGAANFDKNFNWQLQIFDTKTTDAQNFYFYLELFLKIEVFSPNSAFLGDIFLQKNFWKIFKKEKNLRKFSDGQKCRMGNCPFFPLATSHTMSALCRGICNVRTRLE